MRNEVKWFDDVDAMRNHHKTEKMGEVGEEFELKEIADQDKTEPPPEETTEAKESVAAVVEPLPEETIEPKKANKSTKKVKGDE